MTNSYSKFWQKQSYRNLWQHPIWGQFQEAAGRKVWKLEVEGASALVIRHNLPKGFCYLEVPRGPLFENEKSLSKIFEKIEKLGKQEGAIFVRMSTYGDLKIEKFKNLKIAIADHHPETSLILDLTKTEEELLAQMKTKGRYNIKVAKKKGVTVEVGTDVDAFYSLLTKTGGRDGFGIHGKEYYQKMLTALGNNAQLLLAKHEGKVIAGGIFIHLDEWGIYYYGASDHNYRNLMAPYLIQWHAIQESKKRGCKYYDFLGIAPENAQNHPWAGVTEFKKKFGGEVISYPKAKDMILRPFWYFLYRVYKKLR